MAPNQGPSVFPIALLTVPGDTLIMSVFRLIFYCFFQGFGRFGGCKNLVFAQKRRNGRSGKGDRFFSSAASGQTHNTTWWAFLIKSPCGVEFSGDHFSEIFALLAAENPQQKFAEQFVTLPALQKNCEYCFRICLGILH